MKIRLSALVVAALALSLLPTAVSAQGSQCQDRSGPSALTIVQREQARNREQSRVRNPDRNLQLTARKTADEEIFGHELMSRRELKRYRKQLRKTGADEPERVEFLARHRDRMLERAEELGVELPADATDPQPVAMQSSREPSPR